MPFPIWLVAFAAAMIALNLNGFLLFDHDEGAFSEATRGMFERGDFITTYLNDSVRFDKPILIYWLQAASISVFGTEVWAFRLPSVIAGVLWVLAIFAFTRRVLDEDSAKVAAMMAASALGINAIAHVATADALLNMLLASTLLCMYRYSVSPCKWLLATIYALMALGTLTKGPVAVAIPLMVGGIYFLTSGLRKEFLQAIFFIPGWILYLAIAAPWYILEYMAHGQAFIDGFILKHNVNRFNNAMEGHDGGLLFYPLVLPFILAPFGGLLIRILPSIRTVFRGGDQLNRFLWIWFLVVLVLFSLASTKLPHYILYGVTPLVILMARYRTWLQSRLLAALFPTIFLALFVAFPLLIPGIQAQLTNPIEIATAERAHEYFDTQFSILSGVALILTLALIFWRRLSPWFALIAAGVVQAVFVWYLFIPMFSETQQRPVWDVAMFARDLDRPVVTQSVDLPSFNVYLDTWTERRSLQPGEIGFAREDRLDRIKHPYRVLYQSGTLMIIEHAAAIKTEAEAEAQVPDTTNTSAQP
ncbi:MAG: glycosyltransferase family 39 protein [Pseudomonadota bacterium]|nr:glycosyltransferase family 39 protein [Pseudomonadota bacterium]